ncbi:MAG: helix-turn-helix transcriptional regulator [Bacteroidota bacterium]|nr:helix-turn-helix transcriptional regulator [Bacteroidota bacterium]
MIERIQEIIKRENLNASRFADEIGLQRSNVSHVLSGRNKPSLDFIMRILERFTGVNADWLLFGKGSYGKANDDLFSGNIDDKAQITGLEEKENEAVQQEDTPSLETRQQEQPVSAGKTEIKKVLILHQDGTFEEFTANN